jgi:alpha-tubulin suppressor-like RCC1 family protein
LGDGGGSTYTSTQSPSAVLTDALTGDTAFRAMSTGTSNTGSITASGMVGMWGQNSFGECGDGTYDTPIDRPQPLASAVLPGEKAFVAIAAGGLHACGITGQGVAACWGDNGDGQLGADSATFTLPLPTLVALTSVNGDSTWNSISGGFAFTCAITGAGVPYCFGADDYGQLGDGGLSAGSPLPSPVDVSAW